MLIPAGQPFPRDCSVIQELNIEAIDPCVISVIGSRQVEVTGWGDTARQFVSCGVSFSVHGGPVRTWPQEHLRLAVNGGGTFWNVEPNEEHGPITKEEYKQLEAEAMYDD